MPNIPEAHVIERLFNLLVEDGQIEFTADTCLTIDIEQSRHAEGYDYAYTIYRRKHRARNSIVLYEGNSLSAALDVAMED